MAPFFSFIKKMTMKMKKVKAKEKGKRQPLMTKHQTKLPTPSNIPMRSQAHPHESLYSYQILINHSLVLKRVEREEYNVKRYFFLFYSDNIK